ncbi:MAG: HAD-IA family hydrolase [Actinomycetota bacterium]
MSLQQSASTSAPRFEPASVQAVVFDIGGVFLYPQYAAVVARLGELGLPAPTELDAFRRAHHAGVWALTDARINASGGVDEQSQVFWGVYDRAYSAELGVEDHADDLADAIRSTWSWPHKGNIDAFHALAADGWPVAIVSNNNGTAADQMVQHGVCQVGPGPLPTVPVIVDSAIEGVAKPDPAIFDPAIEALGLDPGTLLYIGDTVHADVDGATNAGLQVVQLDPFDHHAMFEHPRRATVADIAAELAAARR